MITMQNNNIGRLWIDRSKNSQLFHQIRKIQLFLLFQNLININTKQSRIKLLHQTKGVINNQGLSVHSIFENDQLLLFL